MKILYVIIGLILVFSALAIPSMARGDMIDRMIRIRWINYGNGHVSDRDIVYGKDAFIDHAEGGYGTVYGIFENPMKPVYVRVMDNIVSCPESDCTEYGFNGVEFMINKSYKVIFELVGDQLHIIWGVRSQ